MPRHDDELCPSCGSTFECKVGSVTICHCFDIHLTREESLMLAAKYEGCLCPICLRKEKEALRSKNAVSLNKSDSILG